MNNILEPFLNELTKEEKVCVHFHYKTM